MFLQQNNKIKALVKEIIELSTHLIELLSINI